MSVSTEKEPPVSPPPENTARGNASEELRSYTQRKLVHRRENSARLHRCEELMAKLAEDRFTLAVAELDERLAMSLVATGGEMKAAFERPTQHSEAIEAEIAEKQMASSKLAQIADALARR